MPACVRSVRRAAARLRALHGDQRGTISILSVFALLMIAILLGMVMNAGRHVDGKIRLQNAADSATYSAADCMARGLNSLAFTNHLTCEMLALTGYFQEARDRKAEKFVPEILRAWQAIGPVFARSGFDKFVKMGNAISRKAALEQELVAAFCDWAEAAAAQLLPLCEYVLDNELIPKYQRDVARYWPDVAQNTMMQVALRNGIPDQGRDALRGALWWTRGKQVGGGDDVAESSLPVVDPAIDSSVEDLSRAYRRRLVHVYLNQWNAITLDFFVYNAKMSQFHRLWAAFTCANIERLLAERYRDTNLLFVIRDDEAITNTSLEQYYTYIGVVYWKALPEMIPGLFRNPVEGSSVAYAEAQLFVPRLRWRWAAHGNTGGGPNPHWGGLPGSTIRTDPSPSTSSGPLDWWVMCQGHGGTRMYLDDHWTWIARRDDWNLLNQSWTSRLAPVTQSSIAEILQSLPAGPGFEGADITPPSLGGIPASEIQRISPH